MNRRFLGFSHAQIQGGADMARFEPGDVVLYQEDLSGTPIGARVEGWEIVQGSYETAEFQDRPTLRKGSKSRLKNYRSASVHF